jgi:hypothetical protein
MRTTSIWLALLAVVLGAAAAVAWAGEGPLAPRNLGLRALDTSAAISYDDAQWEPIDAARDRLGLSLLRPTFVRGHARIDVGAGISVEVLAGGTVNVSWEPAVRGWRFVAVRGNANVYAPNGPVILFEGHSMTFTSLGEVYRAPNGYAPGGRVLGLNGLPEVSGFRPFEDDRR